MCAKDYLLYDMVDKSCCRISGGKTDPNIISLSCVELRLQYLRECCCTTYKNDKSSSSHKH